MHSVDTVSSSMNCVSKVGNHCRTCMHVCFHWRISQNFVTVRKRSYGKVMFLHQSVSHSVHRGVYLSACSDTHPPPGRHTPPPGQTPPPPADGHCSGRTVRILLECFLVKRLDWCPKWGILDSALHAKHCLMHFYGAIYISFQWSVKKNCKEQDLFKWREYDYAKNSVSRSFSLQSLEGYKVLWNSPAVGSLPICAVAVANGPCMCMYPSAKPLISSSCTSLGLEPNLYPISSIFTCMIFLHPSTVNLPELSSHPTPFSFKPSAENLIYIRGLNTVCAGVSVAGYTNKEKRRWSCLNLR